MFAQELQGVSFGMPDQIWGTPVGADEGRETYVPSVATGRSLTADDEGHAAAVLGSTIAAKRAVEVGDSITLHDRGNVRTAPVIRA